MQFVDGLPNVIVRSREELENTRREVVSELTRRYGSMEFAFELYSTWRMDCSSTLLMGRLESALMGLGTSLEEEYGNS